MIRRRLARLPEPAQAVLRTVAVVGRQAPVELIPRLDDLIPAIVRVARPGDVVITLGAGSIGGVPHQLTSNQKVTQ